MQVIDYNPHEQAPPMIVALHEYLVGLYQFIREHYQSKIDEMFDAISRQVGFVVTTTVPVDIEIGKDRKLMSVALGAENLKGTLFDKVGAVLSTQDPFPVRVAAGKYRIFLLWLPALKLKLRTDFMEPAHFAGYRSAGLLGSLQVQINTQYVGKVPFHGEPVHWFDPGYVIAAEEAILIHAIDEVYPELRLADRITVARQSQRPAVRPEIPEPAHYRQLEKALESDKAQQIVTEINAVLRRYGF